VDQPVGWTGWRGPKSDGRVPTLPAKLPQKPTIVWRQPLSGKGLGGIAATKDYVIVSDKEALDTTDVYRCLRADTGKEVWAVRTLAMGDLDYGNSSRATPLIWKELVFFYSAFGSLQCVELDTGKSVWDVDIKETFAANDKRKWGFSTSPLIVDDKLIINPGGEDASLVALEPKTGKVIWKTPGKPASYGNFLAGTFGGVKQVIGWDQDTLGGWNVATGKRLWEFKPKNNSFFNVPTPLAWGDKLAVAIESNGTYLFRFKEKGVLDPEPVARYGDLAPDTHTPVVTAGRVFGVKNGLHCLDLKNDLKRIYLGKDAEFGKYCSVVASEDRVLVSTLRGELILLNAKADEFKVLSRLQVLEEEHGCYAHPAFVGTRVYMRGDACILCVDLSN
jgi:outer membrane protein assembly factor BamB